MGRFLLFCREIAARRYAMRDVNSWQNSEGMKLSTPQHRAKAKWWIFLLVGRKQPVSGTVSSMNSFTFF